MTVMHAYWHEGLATQQGDGARRVRPWGRPRNPSPGSPVRLMAASVFNVGVARVGGRQVRNKKSRLVVTRCSLLAPCRAALKKCERQLPVGALDWRHWVQRGWCRPLTVRRGCRLGDTSVGDVTAATRSESVRSVRMPVASLGRPAGSAFASGSGFAGQ
jgi:hypothetical protein